MWPRLSTAVPGIKSATVPVAASDRIIGYTDGFTEGANAQGEMFEEGGVPEGYYETEEGEPAIRRKGKAAC